MSARTVAALLKAAKNNDVASMKLLLEASFRVFPPVRPIKVLMHTHEEQVARDTLVFVRGTRGAAPCGGRV